MSRNFIMDTWDEDWVDLDSCALLDPEPIAQLWRCYNTKRNTMNATKVIPWSFLRPLFSTSSGYFPDGTNANHIREKRSRRFVGEELIRMWTYLLSEDTNSLLRECVFDSVKYLWATGTTSEWSFTPFPAHLELIRSDYLFPALWKSMIEAARAFLDSLDMLVSLEVTEHMVKITKTSYVYKGVNTLTDVGDWSNNYLLGQRTDRVPAGPVHVKTDWSDMGEVQYTFLSPETTVSISYAIVEDPYSFYYSTIGMAVTTARGVTEAICMPLTQVEDNNGYPDVLEVDPPYRPIIIFEAPTSCRFNDLAGMDTRASYSTIKLEAVDWGYMDKARVYKTNQETGDWEVIGTLSVGNSVTVSAATPDTAPINRSLVSAGFPADGYYRPDYYDLLYDRIIVNLATEPPSEATFTIARTVNGKYTKSRTTAAVEFEIHASEAWRISASMIP